MENKMTLNDLVYQMENFEYSKEYYQLLVEESEINVMEQFLASFEYAKENTDLSVLMESGFFMENTEDSAEKVDAVKDKLDTKKKGFVGRIKSILERIAKFFQNIINGITKAFNRIGDKIKNMKIRSGITAADQGAIFDAVKSCAANANFPISSDQLKDMQILISKKAFLADNEKLARKVIANLTAGKITVTLTQDSYGDAMSAKQLYKCFHGLNLVMVSANVSMGRYKHAENRYKNIQMNMHKTKMSNFRDGLTMSFQDKDLFDDVVKSINDTLKSLREYQDNDLNRDSNQYGTRLNNRNSEIIRDLSKISADTAKLYAAYTKYATNLTTRIQAIMKSAPAAEPESKKDEPKDDNDSDVLQGEVVDDGGEDAKKIN